MPEEKKKKPGVMGLIHGALFMVAVLTGLFVHYSVTLYNWLTVGGFIILSLYFSRREKPLFGPTLFFLMAYLLTMLPFEFARLGFVYIVPLAIYSLVLWIFPSIRKQARWFHLGSMDKFTFLAGLAIAALSSGALYAWAVVTKPNLRDLMAMVPNQSLGALLLVGFGFAVVNSFVEESIYRGIIWEALGKVFRNLYAVILLQAAVFGIAHIQGFPRGALGVAMAFVYGIMLGWLRNRSKGLLAPIIVHLIADIVIYIILVGMTGKF